MSDDPIKFDPTKFTSIVQSTNTATVAFLGFAADSTLLEQWKPVKPPDDHKIYSFVGRVASDWAHVEHLFDEIIWRLGAQDEIKGACITAQMMGVYPRCKAIVALLTAIGRRKSLDLKPLIDRTIELMNKASGPTSPGDRRNRIVHDPWYVYTGVDQTAQFKAMPHKDFRYGIHPVDLTELQETLQAIKNYSERVTKLRDDIYSTLGPSP
jgi:hypothetical protein